MRRFVHPIAVGILLLAWLLLASLPRPLGLPLPRLGPWFNPAVGFWQNTDERGREDERTLSVDHPLARGEVHFDERGVPHVFAPDLKSALFLQGYLHAYDRLWQLDINSRAAEGALAQVLGSSVAAKDSAQIQRGFREMARRMVDTMARHFPEDFAALEAYSAGVNAYLTELKPADYPLEYKLLGYAPQAWSPYRTALITKQMSAGLSGRYDDAAAGATRDLLGPARFDELFPQRFPDDSPVVPDPPARTATFSMWGSPGQPNSRRVARGSADEYAAHGSSGEYHPGSNNWAVAPARTNTGYPLLASDPHLRLTYPSVWYEMHMVFPGCNARGVGIVGAPGLMMGYNDYAAWGETNVGHDVTDWYRIDWTDAERTTYRLDGRPTPATVIYDTLRVRGEAERIVGVPWTVFGPVPYTEGPYADMAMRWLAQDEPGADERPHTIVGTFLSLMQARDYDDYLQALRGYVDPAQNFLFASREGDIVIRPNGFFPLREPGQGRFIQEGDSSSRNWRGSIPFAERPEHRNPPRGYVSSANQQTTGPAYPYYYLGRFADYRGRYINRVLGQQPNMTQRRMKELQLSTYSLLAEELAPLLIARVNRGRLGTDGARLLRLLSEWDFRYAGDSRAATLFDRWYHRVYERTFDELTGQNELLEVETWRWNDLLAEQPDHPIFDIQATADVRETATTLTQQAFDELLEEYGSVMPLPWADHRAAAIDHLAGIPGLGSPVITTGGARTTPRVVGNSFGGSWRMVVELGRNPRGWGALPGGPSGHPGSRYYDNGFADWEQGRYHELEKTARPPMQTIGSWHFE